MSAMIRPLPLSIDAMQTCQEYASIKAPAATYSSLHVTNTFLDTFELTDGSAIPQPGVLRRTKTATATYGVRPCEWNSPRVLGTTSLKSVSTDDLDSPRSPVASVSSPSSASSCTNMHDISLQALPALPASHEEVKAPFCGDLQPFSWELTVKNTFVDYRPPPSLPRSNSAPQLKGLAQDCFAERLAVALGSMQMSQASNDVFASMQFPDYSELEKECNWPSTPQDDDFIIPMSFAPEFCDLSFVDMSMPLMPPSFSITSDWDTDVWAAPEWVASDPPPHPPEDALHKTVSVPHGLVLPPQSSAAVSRQKGVPSVDETQALDFLANVMLRHQGISTGELGGYRRTAWELARKDPRSSAIVQKSFDILATWFHEAVAQNDTWSYEATCTNAWALMSELRGHVQEGLENQHANHVFKQLAETMPTEYVGWMAEELKGHGLWAARHRFGCRTMLRLVRHCGLDSPEGKHIDELIEEVLPHGCALCRDQFGNYVIQEVIETGLPAQRHTAAVALRQHLLRNATDRHGSRIIEKALKHCDTQDSDVLAKYLLASVDTARRLMQSDFGCHVLRTLAVSGSPEHNRAAFGYVTQLKGELEGSKRGRRLLEEVRSA